MRSIKIHKISSLILLYMVACASFFMEGSYKFGLYYLDFVNFCLFLIAAIYIISLKGKIALPDLADPFDKMILVFFVILILQLFYTHIYYGQPYVICIKMAYYYLVLFIYCLLKHLLHNDHCQLDLGKLLVQFSVFCNIYTILNYFGRNAKVCAHFYLLFLSFPVAMSYILYKKNFLLGLVLMITSLIVDIIALESTAYVLIYLGSIVGTTLYYIWEKYNYQNKAVLAIVIGLFLLFMLTAGIIQSEISKLITGDVGNHIRVYAIEYYFGKLREQPVFGLGLLDPSFSKSNYAIIHGGKSPLGGWGQYYLEDIGLIGFICSLGLISLIILFYLIVGVVKYTKESEGMYRIQNIGLCIVGGIMLISLCPFNKAPIQIVPLMLLLFYLNSTQNKIGGL